MLSAQRKQQILAILAAESQVMSGDLSLRFGVSEDSVRRDLRELAADGLLQRVHGGALPVSAATADIQTRKNVQTLSKQYIAKKAARLIQPGQVVIIDGGTTTEAMVRQLPKDLIFTAITHSPTIAVALAELPLVEVILIGGQLYRHSLVAVGSTVFEAIARINADLFFMGVTGVHKTAGLTTGNYEEAGVKRALASRAAETIVMVSKEKLNSASAYAIGDLAMASTMIIDGDPAQQMPEWLQQKGITLL